MLVQNSIENALIWAAIFYFLPSAVALGRGRFASVFALNLFLGWTLVGWVMALVWALAPSQSHVNSQHAVSGEPKSADRVLTTITQELSMPRKPWQTLQKGQAVLLKSIADERWSVSSEEGVLGYLDSEAAKVVTFRFDAIGKPKAKIIRIDKNIDDGIAADLEIVFGA